MTKKPKVQKAIFANTATEPSASWVPFGMPVHEVVLALGLGGLIFVRPWVDGLTYPEKNTYFVWLVSGLFALWSARLLFRKEDLRYPIHNALLGVFVAIAFVTGLYSVQFDATYRALLNWASYLMIFMMAASGLRSPGAAAIILGFFVLTSFAETVWSILHIKYLMPIQREAMKDPALLMRYFDTPEMTAEIRSRLESNRAMGSLLFANALACWVLVGIPFGIGGAAHAWLKFRGVNPAPFEAEPLRNRRALLLGLVTGFGSFVAIAIYYSFYFAFAYSGDSWTNHLIRWSLYCAILPSSIGAGTFLAVHRIGTRNVVFRIQCGVLAALAVLQCVGLAHTYSRGGMLATAATLVLGAALVWYGGKTSGAARAVAVAVLVLFVAATGVKILNESAWAAAGQQPSDTGVDLRGVDPSFDAMMNPATAFLRLSYWRSGLEIARANPWTGVGLDNFGTVYPKYQLPGSADVKQAHNDFLQTFCETGLFGGIVFLAFWVYFGWWGARRILREADSAHRWLLAGVYCGTLGFVFHAVVDFNFANPALATLVFLFGGLFLSLAANSSTPVLKVKFAATVGAPGLLIAAAVVAFGWRVYQLDTTVGNNLERKLRLEAAIRLLDIGNDGTSNPANTGFAQISDRAVSLLIPSREARETFGKIYTRLQPGSASARPVSANEPIPDDSILLVMIPREAKARAQERIPTWLEIFADADARYPYDPDVAAHLCLWYEMLFGDAKTPEERLRYAEKSVEWAEQCVERSPEQVKFRNLLARCYWRRGEVDETETQLKFYDAALDQYLKCIELFPSRADVYYDYARIARSYGELRRQAGDIEGGQSLIDKAAEVQQQGERLEQARGGAPRTG